MKINKLYYLKNSNNGFTLIEILVAITILSYIMVNVYQVIDHGAETKDKVSFKNRNLLQIETALNRFKLDFSQIYSPIYFSNIVEKKDMEDDDEYSIGKFKTTERFPFVSSRDIPVPEILTPNSSTFIFFTSVNKRKFANSKQSNYAWIKYTLETSKNNDDNQDQETGKYSLVRYYNPLDIFFPTFSWENIKPQTLIEGIKSLSFLYWDSTNKSYRKSIQDLDKIDKHALQGVKIMLEWIENGEEFKIERIYRPIWPFFDPNVDIEALKNINKIK